jgi:hypothetical protein
VFYTNQALTAARVPALPPAGAEAVALIVATVLAEASVPVLIVVPLRRHAGVLLGLVFHGLVSLDIAQHFYDFKAVLLAVFVLFLAEDVTLANVTASPSAAIPARATRRHRSATEALIRSAPSRRLPVLSAPGCSGGSASLHGFRTWPSPPG